MSSGQLKVGRNELCPCGSGRKAKYCCSACDADRFLAGLSRRGTRELDEMCEDCQTEAWFDVLDLPETEEACRLVVSAPRPAPVLRLGEALRRGDPDAVADELPAALAAVDCPAARAGVARTGSRRCRSRMSRPWARGCAPSDRERCRNVLHVVSGSLW